MRVTTLVAIRATESHNLLSCYLRANGGVKVPVVNISEVNDIWDNQESFLSYTQGYVPESAV